MQLELFSPNRFELAEGWEAVASLDFTAARYLFEGVARRCPDDSESTEALELLDLAEERLPRLRALPPADRIDRLWASRTAFPDSVFGRRFRTAILDATLREIDAVGLGRSGDDPCRGEVLLELGRIRQALDWLGADIETAGRTPLKYLELSARALWALAHRSAARGRWLQWLLSEDPEPLETRIARIQDDSLQDIIRAHGVERAPLEAWFSELAPLLEEEELPPFRSPELATYRTVLLAESARKRGDLEEAIRHRKALMKTDPDLLRRYMRRIGG